MQDGLAIAIVVIFTELNSYNIVITTLSTALVLAHMDLEGFFTHIFIDEVLYL